jgi:hypothetical protein
MRVIHNTRDNYTIVCSVSQCDVMGHDWHNLIPLTQVTPVTHCGCIFELTRVSKTSKMKFIKIVTLL